MKKILFTCCVFVQTIAVAQPSKSPTSGVSIFLEEDSFNGHFNQDRNYTGGGAITLSGSYTNSNWFIAPYFRNKLDHVFGIERLSAHFLHAAPDALSNAFSFGTTIFTPLDIAQAAPVIGDRPYASLTFISSRQTSAWEDNKTKVNHRWAITTELTLGMLGTVVGDSLQTWIHRSIIKNHPGNPGNRPIPQGWKNQISNGGEPTAMYKLTVQQKLGEVFINQYKNIKAIELSSMYEAQLGYYTNLAAGLTLKVGFFNTNFWENNSNFGNVGNQFAAAEQHSNPLELYGFISARSRLIGYNALLEGQFKKTAYKLTTHEINHLVSEFEMGFALRIYRLTFMYEPIAGRSSELNNGYARTHIWGAANVSFNWPIAGK